MVIFMENAALVLFGIFLLTLIVLDISMIVSLLRTGDERRQLIVWKASTFTLLVVVGGLLIDIVESFVRGESLKHVYFSTTTKRVQKTRPPGGSQKKI